MQHGDCMLREGGSVRSKTPLGRVHGLGSAHSGTHRWFRQRLTAATNLILLVWFLTSMVRLSSLDHQALVLWLSSPVAAVPLILLVLFVAYHLRFGLQTIIDDYSSTTVRLTLTLLASAYAVTIAAVCIFSILKIAFGGVRP
jgi:succinate dehydrogenase / fumarate reductase membrane anchor subunit